MKASLITWCPRLYLGVSWLLALVALPCDAGESAGFRVPEGFVVTQFADDALAHDIFSMTCDTQGRVVVSGPGYIRTLLDDDGDGIADRAVEFANAPVSGAQGLCFAGTQLLATGDGALLRFRDENRDGLADGPPDLCAQLRNPEHGAHGILQGPDGWFYIACGNDSGLGKNHINSPASPVADPLCGGILRISPDGQRREVVADGFRNPYDLAFTPNGRLLTVDSDGERDQHLPWYEPTRMFDVAQGRSHGWLEGGWTKSWSRPECFFDNVDRVCTFGRGSPTGLEVYRHRQFPERYRGGVFAACWTFGRIYFVPLTAAGSTLRGDVEVFAATVGENGFAPVDLAVGPRGDLFVAIGGRKTRGGVYRIHFAGGTANHVAPDRSPEDKLRSVLEADQPLASWSRARWLPVARELGAEAFVKSALDAALPRAARIRAVEIVTELFAESILEVVSQIGSEEPEVTARAIWAAERWSEQRQGVPDPTGRKLIIERLARFTGATSPIIQRAAWEALATSGPILSDGALNLASLRFAWDQALDSSDRRVRAAMITFAQQPGKLAFEHWRKTSSNSRSPSAWAAELLIVGIPTAAMARDELLRQAVAAHVSSTDAATRLEALRLVQLALGDLQLSRQGEPNIPGYTPQGKSRLDTQRSRQIASELADGFPSGNEQLDRETARTIGLTSAAARELLATIADLAVKQPSAAQALHYLFVLASLEGERSPDATQNTAAALVRLHEQLAERREYPSRNWPEMVELCFDRLAARDSNLALAVVNDQRWGRPEHALFLRHLPGDLQRTAARRLFARARDAHDAEAWTPELISALRSLPATTWQEDDVLAALRLHWDDFRLRDAIAIWLASAGQHEDRDRLVEALASPQSEVVIAAANSLLKLPPAGSTEDLLAVLAALRQAASGAPRTEQSLTADQVRRSNVERQLWQKGEPLRASLDQLLRHWASNSHSTLPTIQGRYEPWLEWFRAEHPDRVLGLASSTGIDVQAWNERLAKIDWSQGNSQNGEKVFERQACHRCHRGDNRLGPALAGAISRLTREDLLAAIYDPQREVAEPYRTRLLATRSGQVHHGLVIYESPEGTLIQTSPDTTVRVAGDDLLTVQPSNRSLMPTGLLDPLSDRELADLIAYLATMCEPPVGGER